jgi:solute carrier family 38 (sodium-coupled neutral amino acid transporter), member 11
MAWFSGFSSGAVIPGERARLLPGSGGGGGGGEGKAPGGHAPGEKTTLFWTALNLLNGVVGAGILALPAAFDQAGLPVALFLCVLVAVLSAATMRMLAASASAHGAAS